MLPTEHRCLVCHRPAQVNERGIILPHHTGERLCANSGRPKKTALELLKELDLLKAHLEEIRAALEHPGLDRNTLQRFAAGHTSIHESTVLALISAARKAVNMPPVWDEEEQP